MSVKWEGIIEKYQSGKQKGLEGWDHSLTYPGGQYAGCGSMVPWSAIEPRALLEKVRSPNQLTVMEVCTVKFYISTNIRLSKSWSFNYHHTLRFQNNYMQLDDYKRKWIIFKQNISSPQTFHDFYCILPVYCPFKVSHFDQPSSLSCPAPHLGRLFPSIRVILVSLVECRWSTLCLFQLRFSRGRFCTFTLTPYF